MANKHTTHELVIQLIKEEHFQAAVDIINESIRLGDATLWLEELSVEWFAAQVRNQQDREETYALLLEEQLIGWGVIKKYSPKEGYNFTCETSIFLSRTHTGKGYGTILKKFVLNRCKQLNYHHVVARILASNSTSIAYNKKLGYGIVGIQKEVGRSKAGWVDVLIMQYLVNE